MKKQSRRNQGEVFTSNHVVHYILDEVGYSSGNDLRNIKILEPAAGKGAFAKEIVVRLFKSSVTFQFPFVETLINTVQFIELNRLACSELVTLIDSTIEHLTHAKSEIGSRICMQADFLTRSFDRSFDCIVGNPPYIRHELISEADKKYYRATYTTFKHRADLYVPFYEKSLSLLTENGILSFICSNRWLYNQYGEGLRELISTKYNLVKLLNIEKSSPFDEDVIAYPCIAFISKSVNAGTTFLFEDNSKEIDFTAVAFRKIRMPVGSSWQNLFLEYDINHEALLGIVEQGFKIGIGVATGLDKVFIKSKNTINGIEKSRLIPLVRSSDLKNDTFQWGGHFVINPYENETLCDLDSYPHLKSYFLANKELLLKRHTVQKSPDKWFKTIDKIYPKLQHTPKLLLPDLTGNKILFIDEGNYYPHHNLYFITSDNISNLKLLAAILMSGFAKKQMMQIGIRMNGGLPRFQSQILKKIKIPNLTYMDETDKRKLINSFDNLDLEILNQVVDSYCAQHDVLKSYQG